MASVLSIVDATNACIGFVRPIREGEEVLNAGLVISVGLKEKTDNILHIHALVLRTSGISTQRPYLVELWVDVKKDYGSRLVKEKSQECECKTGQSEKCKHVISVMLFLARVKENDLEDLSCTDIQQQWGALKASTLAEYAAKRLQDLCHVQDQRNVYVAALPDVSKEVERKWERKLLLSKHPCSSLTLQDFQKILF